MLLFAQAAAADPITEHLLTPIMQLGFAGVAIILFAILFWLIKSRRSDWLQWNNTLMTLLVQSNELVKNNTVAFKDMTASTLELAKELTHFGVVVERMHEQLLCRPCLLPPTITEPIRQEIVDILGNQPRPPG